MNRAGGAVARRKRAAGNVEVGDRARAGKRAAADIRAALSAPLFVVVPAVLVSRPDSVAPALLLKVPASRWCRSRSDCVNRAGIRRRRCRSQTPLLVMAPLLVATLAK